MTKNFVVYVEDEKLFYQYIRNRWRLTNAAEILENLIAFYGRLRLDAIDQVLGASTNDNTIITKHIPNITIKTWPKIMGYNFANGFLTIRNNLYTLIPHNPALWQKNIFDVEIPPEILPYPSEKIVRLFLDLT